MKNTGLIKVEAPETMKPAVEFIAYGSDDSVEKQLVQKSSQPNILRFTPKDHKKRFGDIDMLRKWKSKGRIVHWLLGPNDDLAGIIWYGESAFPLDIDLHEKPNETFAIRLYDGYVGHGLAKPFMVQSLIILVSQKKKTGANISPIWLQTDVDNPAAIAAYSKFGYEEVARDEKRVTMVLDTDTISLITKTSD